MIISLPDFDFQRGVGASEGADRPPRKLITIIIMKA